MYNQQATLAHTDLVNAQNAASAAEKNFKDAQQKGQQAYEAYMQEASALARRIGAAVGELKAVQAPRGGAPAPVSITPADVSLASAMMGGLGAIPTSGVPTAAEMEKLACGLPLTPGATYQFLLDYRAKQQQERAAEQHQGSGGGVLDWVWNRSGALAVTGVKDAADFTYKHAGTISAVAGAATLIPGVDVVAAPVAIATERWQGERRRPRQLSGRSRRWCGGRHGHLFGGRKADVARLGLDGIRTVEQGNPARLGTSECVDLGEPGKGDLGHQLRPRGDREPGGSVRDRTTQAA